ncbi:hypothetical protein CSQ89_06230 [Chitinimonas sp. BJB300]|nr:hypothetical protein CSQ89_06230 [Chitinimonas sp. BJB300]
MTKEIEDYKVEFTLSAKMKTRLQAFVVMVCPGLEQGDALVKLDTRLDEPGRLSCLFTLAILLPRLLAKEPE